MTSLSFLDSSNIIGENPATGEKTGTWKPTSFEDISKAIQQARQAQTNWAALSVAERCKKLKPFQHAIVSNADNLCRWISEETGKPIEEALWTEVMVVIDTARYFLKKGARILSPKRIALHLLKHRKSTLFYEPRGVVGIISPWNFPFSIPLCEMFMALIAGNAVVLKPSEHTPLIALRTKTLFDSCGLPPDLFQILPGNAETGKTLIQSGIDYCIFTGSTKAGRQVAAACGEKLIPCALELGGKAPAIVCADADITRTAKALVWGAFANSGQVCVSVERAYVHEQIYDALVAALERETQALRQGSPASAEVDVGSMTLSQQRSHVHALVQTAKADGARLVCGGTLPQGPGRFYPPTLLVDCTQDMAVMRQEIFGPVLPVMKVTNHEQALALANDSDLGLMAYLFTENRTQAIRIAQRLQTGMVMINDCLTSFAAPEMPWVGIKSSGLSLTHSPQGLRALCQTKSIDAERFRFKKPPWWFPYRRKTHHTLLRWLPFLRA